MSTQEDAPEDPQAAADAPAETDAGPTSGTGEHAAAGENDEETSDDGTVAEEEPEASAERTDDPPPDDPLERMTERIEKARTQAEDAGVIDDTEERYFAESGATEVEDDQTIAPPG